MFFFPASINPASSFSSCHSLLLRTLPLSSSATSCHHHLSPFAALYTRFFLLPSSFFPWPLCSCAANLSVGKAPPVSAEMEEAETKGDGEALTSFPVAGTEPVPRGQDQIQSRKSMSPISAPKAGKWNQEHANSCLSQLPWSGSPSSN